MMLDDPLTPGSSDQGPPPSLICPITQELLEDPVIAADGFTYERAAIERWLGMGSNRRSPTTNAPLAHRALVPNRTLASMVHAYRSRLGRAVVDAVLSEDDEAVVAKRVRLLAERGADVDAVEDSGRSVLLVAVANKRYIVADALVDAGSRVSSADGSPSPLLACLEGEEAGDVENPLVSLAHRAANSSTHQAKQVQAKRLKALAQKCVERCRAEQDLDAQRNERVRTEADRASRTDAARASHAQLGQLAQAGTQDNVATGAFGSARLRQRGFFPSVVALQLTSAPAGPGRRRWSCCAVDEPHVPNASYRERVAMRRLRAAILSVGAVLLFFLFFG